MQIQDYTQKYIGIWQKRDISQIQNIGICHTASKQNGRTLEQICDNVNNWHQTQYWPKISYHIMISESGEIAQCNQADDITYCVGPKNLSTFCICLDGNFETDDKPSQPQLEALEFVIFKHMKELGLSSSDVYGDKELGSNTACPGKWLMPFIQDFRINSRFTILDKYRNNPTTVFNEKKQEILNSSVYYQHLLIDQNTQLIVDNIIDKDIEISLLKGVNLNDNRDTHTLKYGLIYGNDYYKNMIKNNDYKLAMSDLLDRHIEHDNLKKNY